jgi:uncharacterized linocin/CFP29 family protein
MENIVAAKALFGGATGRWATAQLKKAFTEGRSLSASALRTLDTLRHEEWKFFDDALVKEAAIRLVGVADLIAGGFTRNVTNALGKMVFAYEKVTDMDPATTSLDGLSRTGNDRQEFDLNQIPLPITHKDFFINLRTLAASRERGEALDTTQVQTAGRVVAEQLEKMLFQGGPTFGGMPIYGYTTQPDRNHGAFDGTKDWGDSTKVGSSYLADVKTMKTALAADRFYGPYTIYVPADADVLLDGDYNAGTANTQTIRERLLKIAGLTAIKVADQLPSGSVIMKQDSTDVAAWVNGEPLQTVQWDEYGGFEINFKAFAIGVPLIRSDAAGRSGVYHMSDAG